MRYRALGKTGLKVSEIGFGTIPILSGNVPVLPEYFSPDTETAVAILPFWKSTEMPRSSWENLRKR